MARVLSKRGVELILAARRTDRLEELKQELGTPVRIIGTDLSRAENCKDLYEQVKDEDIDILINNAGFGDAGKFAETSLVKEMTLIDTNIRATHILTKLFVRDFRKKNRGYLLNVASSAGFLPGPNMAVYYASKSYILRLSEALYEELRREHSSVSVSILCPGPVNTEFSSVADVRFRIRGLNSYRVAEYAIDRMFRRKLVIIPGMQMKAGKFLERFVSEKMLCRISYHIQQRAADNRDRHAEHGQQTRTGEVR